MIKDKITYKCFTGTLDYSLEDECWFGSIVEVRGLITYEAKTLKELRVTFQETVDDYIEFKKENNL